ncbi:Xaa-Pro peptidase family protein [Aquibium sp. LZ166]|uniref:Xaa-Pro peptidase family protein n=1 Tax=Aquibium pacificus TaxID=3153579 RepID=A0ABV3SJG1_9HYPH
MAGASMLAGDRVDRVASVMNEAGVDTLVVYGNAWQNDCMRYVADFGILEGQGLAVMRQSGEVTLYLDSPLEADRASVESPGLTVVHVPDLVAAVGKVLANAGNSRIAAAPMHLLPRGIAARSAELRLTDLTPQLELLLMRKLDAEVDAIRAAAHLADEGYEVFLRAARPGRADYELVAEVEAFYRSKGVDDNFMILGCGGTEVRGMAPPSGKRLKKGDLVTTELTPCIGGYYVQICRTLVMGEPSAGQRAAFAVYDEALVAGIASVRHGALASEVARAENDVFRRHGLGEYVTDAYTRVRGHGLGLYVDTKPQILEDVHIPLEAGMTIIVHPNTYHPAVGYMVHGDALIVRQDGAEVLTGTPRRLFSVPA